MAAIKYLASNEISVRSFLTKNPFPKSPFELKGSEKFIESVKFDKYETVKEALEKDKNYLTQYDYMKQTGFHWAAKLGYSKMLNLLLDYGKCCNSFDEKYCEQLNNMAKAIENNTLAITKLMSMIDDLEKK